MMRSVTNTAKKMPAYLSGKFIVEFGANPNGCFALANKVLGAANFQTYRINDQVTPQAVKANYPQQRIEQTTAQSARLRQCRPLFCLEPQYRRLLYHNDFLGCLKLGVAVLQPSI
jgi:hypothetical protein